jgi:hypothetical protein
LEEPTLINGFTVPRINGYIEMGSLGSGDDQFDTTIGLVVNNIGDFYVVKDIIKEFTSLPI